MKSFVIVFALLSLFPAGKVAASEKVPVKIERLVDSLRLVYAPDKRVALFEVDCALSGRKVQLRGTTTSVEAKRALKAKLLDMGYQVEDGLKILPDFEELGGKVYGIVNLSVANLHKAADHSSEMVTQALLGMPVRVLQCDDWYRIQTPDNYIAWVHREGVVPVTKEKITAWNEAEKVVVTSHYGFVYSAPARTSQVVSDVVAGDRLKWEGEDGNFKLGDFGAATLLGSKSQNSNGTYNYIAPEIYRQESPDFTSDLYSLGLVMYKLLNHNKF